MGRGDGWFDVLQRPADVDKASPSDGDALIWDSALQLWVPKAGGSSAPGTVYFGDPDTNGSWRMRQLGNNLVVERREAGNWIEKGVFEP